jgi:predicted GIY-YIG superfamily endonuclease
MPDYSKGVIYTIKTGDNLYVGSTTDFMRRKSQHKHIIFNENNPMYNSNLYRKIRENNGLYDIEIYKQFPCNNNKELRIEEEQIKKYLNADLNNNRCYQTLEERREYMYKFSKTKVICECGVETQRNNLPRHRRTKKHIEIMTG